MTVVKQIYILSPFFPSRPNRLIENTRFTFSQVIAACAVVACKSAIFSECLHIMTCPGYGRYG